MLLVFWPHFGQGASDHSYGIMVWGAVSALSQSSEVFGQLSMNYKSPVQEIKPLNVYKFRIFYLLLLLWLFKKYLANIYWFFDSTCKNTSMYLSKIDLVIKLISWSLLWAELYPLQKIQWSANPYSGWMWPYFKREFWMAVQGLWMQTAIFRMDGQWGPTVHHWELCMW